VRLLDHRPAHHIEPIANLFSPLSGSLGLAFDYNLMSGSAHSSIPQPSELDLVGYSNPSLATNSSLQAPLINSETDISRPEQGAELQGISTQLLRNPTHSWLTISADPCFEFTASRWISYGESSSGASLFREEPLANSVGMLFPNQEPLNSAVFNVGDTTKDSELRHNLSPISAGNYHIDPSSKRYLTLNAPLSSKN